MADVQDEPKPDDAILRDPSSDYHQLNAGANRRQATNVRAPALTWHRAFWLSTPPKGATIQREKELEEDRLQKKATIDSIILSVWAFLHKKSCDRASGFTTPECHPRVCRPIQSNTNPIYVHLLFSRAVTTEVGAADHICFKPVNKLRRREEEILNSDNRVVSLRYSWQGLTMTIRTELHSEYFLLTVYAEFPDNPDAVLPARVKQNYDAIVRHFETANLGDASTLNEFFFHAFWSRVFLKEFLTDQYLCKKLDDKIFHDIFADFRGLIISNDTRPIRLEKIGASEELDWATQIDKQCLQLFTDHHKYECTANYMLDGRAAYFTTLAPQTPEAPDNKLIPLEYILYVHRSYQLPIVDGQPGASGGVNRWQLGRLIDRIHLLGTVRLASLKYLPSLRRAGNTLSHLSSYVNVAREAIDPEKKTAPIDAGDAISKVHSTFGRITTDFNEATGTDTGILYRIEQSRYYKEQFDKNMKALRIGRMEGYQKYDQFIERRLGPAIDFIDRLGRRYERATNNITTLDQNYLTMKIASIDTETNHIEAGIRRIQQWGEFVLLAILVPYYVTHLLVLTVEQRYTPLMIAIVLLWIIAIAFAVFQKSKKILFAAVAVAIAAIVALLVLPFLRDPSSEPPATQSQLVKTLSDTKADLEAELEALVKAQGELLHELREQRLKNNGSAPDFQE